MRKKKEEGEEEKSKNKDQNIGFSYILEVKWKTVFHL